jgi:mono/diheme cytochrome c family protein
MRVSDLALVVLVGLVACGAEQRPEPQLADILIPQTRQEVHGKRLFQRFCYQCHPGGSEGLGPALDDKLLAKAAIRTQIRAGTGAMPAFGKDWLTDRQVAEIADYVTTLHREPARTAAR